MLTPVEGSACIFSCMHMVNSEQRGGCPGVTTTYGGRPAGAQAWVLHPCWGIALAPAALGPNTRIFVPGEAGGAGALSRGQVWFYPSGTHAGCTMEVSNLGTR